MEIKTEPKIEITNKDEYSAVVYVNDKFYGRLVLCEGDDLTEDVWVFSNHTKNGEYVGYYDSYEDTIEELKEDIKREEKEKMKKVNFEEQSDGSVLVTVNGNKYGVLEFDKDQEAWVLWPESIDDGVTYYEELDVTEEEIKEEIINA